MPGETTPARRIAADPLLQPLTIRGITFKNRVASTAHAPGYAEGGLPGERYQLYHEAKARGGLALTIFGGSSGVSTDGSLGHIDVSNDRCIAPFATFAQRIHAHGCALICQISHLGRRARNGGTGLPLVAPSAVREPMTRGFAKEIEPHDIKRIVDDYASAARRCRKAGLDGVELLATSHLIGQFLSPAANRRHDSYGGSLENRARFALEVLEAVRGAVGEAMIVSFRLTGDEMLQGGMSAQDCLEAACLLGRSGRIDLLNMLGGNAFSEPGIARNIPGMGTPTAPYLKLAAAMRAQTGLPLIHATRITDLETARYAIANGMLDMVGLTRAHIADPGIVAKLERQETDRIRPCVGARLCLEGGVHGGSASACVHNPATGRERLVPQMVRRTEGRRLDVAVVGGGPAGLEAARVCALRGHTVRLFEAAERLGGQVLVAARARGRAEIREIAGWLEREVGHAGVSVQLGAYLDPADVAGLGAEVVIDATGGLPTFGDVADPDGLLVSSWEVLEGGRTVRGEVLFFDDHGGHQGLSCAATLCARGDVRLSAVTPERFFGVGLGDANRPQYIEALYGAGAALLPDRRLTAVARDGNRVRAELQNAYAGQRESMVVDHVVVEAGSAPNTLLYDGLAPLSANKGAIDLERWAAGEPQKLDGEGFMLWRIGDAVAHRGIHAAMLDARRLCQGL